MTSRVFSAEKWVTPRLAKLPAPPAKLTGILRVISPTSFLAAMVSKEYEVFIKKLKELESIPLMGKPDVVITSERGEQLRLESSISMTSTGK
jgi:hypothetical protein